MTSLIVDTNAYVRFLEGDRRAVEALERAQEIHLPLVVYGELMAGFASGRRTADNRATLDHFMASRRAALMLLDKATAYEYGRIFAELRGIGRPMPTNDVWIAALARQHEMPLLTFDAHFASVQGILLAAGR